MPLPSEDELATGGGGETSGGDDSDGDDEASANRRERTVTQREPDTATVQADDTVGGASGQNRAGRLKDREPDTAADPRVEQTGMVTDRGTDTTSDTTDVSQSGPDEPRATISSGAVEEAIETGEQAVEDTKDFATRNRGDTVQGTSVAKDTQGGAGAARVREFVTRNRDESISGANAPRAPDETDVPTAEETQRFLRTGSVDTPAGEVPIGTQAVSDEVRDRYEVGGFAGQFTDQELDPKDLPDKTLLSLDFDPNRGGFASQYTPGGVDAGDTTDITQSDARTASGQAARDLIVNPATAAQTGTSLAIEAGQETDFIIRGPDDELSEEDFVRATGYQRGAFASQYTETDTTDGVKQTGRAEQVTGRTARTLTDTGEFLLENPARAAGSIGAGALLAAPASVATGAAIGRGSRLFRDRVRTFGGSKVELEDITQKEVVRNVETGGTKGRRFPAADEPDLYTRDAPEAVRRQATARTPEDVKQAFEEAGVDEGVTLKKALGTEPEGPDTGRAAQGFESAPGETLEDFDYETPGSFVGPDLSPNFLRVEGGRSFSLRPGIPDAGNRPTGMLIRTDIEAPDADTMSAFNKELIERGGETTARTKPEAAVATQEIEAVIPPGSEFVDVGGGGVLRNTARRFGIGSDFYTEVGGRRVPLRLAAAADDVDGGGTPGIRSFFDDDRAVAGGAPQTRRRTFQLSELQRTLRQPVDRPTPLGPVPSSGATTADGSDRRDDLRDRERPAGDGPSESPESSPPESTPPSSAPPSGTPPSSGPPSSGPPSSVPPSSGPPSSEGPGSEPPSSGPPSSGPPSSGPPSSGVSGGESPPSPPSSPIGPSSGGVPVLDVPDTPPPARKTQLFTPEADPDTSDSPLRSLDVQSFTPLSEVGFGLGDVIEDDDGSGDADNLTFF